METREYISDDNYKIKYNIWKPEGIIKGLVHINHGMAEHSKRYDRFAKLLNKEGYLVFAQDHRGHGQSVIDDQIQGHLSDTDGWMKMCSDAYNIALTVSKEYCNIPVLLFGHSMGSFISRTLIIKYPNFYKAAVIMGTGYKPAKLLEKIGKHLAKKGVKTLHHTPNKKLDKLVFGGFAKKIPNAKTPFDWLSRDEKEVQKYIEDKDCGYVCTSQFYYDIIEGNSFANDKTNLKNSDKSIPLFIISGSDDPVGANAKGVKKVAKMYEKAGYKVNFDIVQGGRHELLNEINKEQVMDKIITWYNNQVK